MEDIFISGYSGRFPNSNDVQSLFRNLKEKRDCVGESKRYLLKSLGTLTGRS
jgi:acyl transferase domain-containing protein